MGAITTKWLMYIACLLLAGSLSYSQDKLYSNEFPSKDVVLLYGPFKHARDLNIKVLLEYDVDRLLAGYRKEAGLSAKANIFKNWDGLDGHVAGHYLSALAMCYAATGNKACKKRMEYILTELKACQQANDQHNAGWKKGYLGAVPNGDKIWSTFKNGDITAFRAAWVPFYNIHKMYAGLRDAWLFTNNADAKRMFLKFCDWGINITQSLTDAQMQSVLDIEHGGMNEIYADAFQITDNPKYLIAARRFSHNMLLHAMANDVDNLDNKHANTQVPKAVGFARIGELNNDEGFRHAGQFFWQTVTGNRTLAFGGNSRREFFPAVSSCSDFVNDVEGPESCNSYNMLKLTQTLFREDPQAFYMDYYERTLYNHILSTQHPAHGGYVYFTPVRPRHYRVYSAPNEAMWCCVGSGMENHSKYNELIYTHRNDSLYVNLFIASELNWKTKGIKLRQETNFPYEESTRIKITEGNSEFELLIRYPSWVEKNELKVFVNGKQVAINNAPSSYISLKRYWKKGDSVRIQLPMRITTERLPNVPEYLAFLHGPILLGATTGTGDLKGLVADDSRWAHIASGKRLSLDSAPVIIEDNLASIADKIIPEKNKPLHFRFSSVKLANPTTVELQPFYQIHDSRYMAYWMALSSKQYQHYIDSLGRIEQEKADLDQRTIDQVAAGEQQPEADHLMEKQNSNTGNFLDEFWRDARSEGYFSYLLQTNGEKNLSLMVRYWGAEWGNRKFDIYIDDQKLVTEDNTGKWNQSKFQTTVYDIPATMLGEKKNIRVKFQSLPSNTAGAVYHIRLVKR